MKNSIYNILTLIIHYLDYCIDIFIKCILMFVLLYGCYGLYDNYMIYNNDGKYNNMVQYKPKDDLNNEESFKELNLLNKDICGWLTIIDTNIDYPILQGYDNSQYINRDFEGEYSMIGSVFLDYRNNRRFGDDYSLLYAHSMDGDRMFGKIPHYLKEEFFNSHLNGFLYVNKQKYQLDIFASVLCDAYDEVFYQPQSIKYSSEFVDYIKYHAKQYRQLSFNNEDKILAMSTCSSLKTNARVIVFARIRK